MKKEQIQFEAGKKYKVKPAALLRITGYFTKQQAKRYSAGIETWLGKEVTCKAVTQHYMIAHGVYIPKHWIQGEVSKHKPFMINGRWYTTTEGATDILNSLCKGCVFEQGFCTKGDYCSEGLRYYKNPIIVPSTPHGIIVDRRI